MARYGLNTKQIIRDKSSLKQSADGVEKGGLEWDPTIIYPAGSIVTLGDKEDYLYKAIKENFNSRPDISTDSWLSFNINGRKLNYIYDNTESGNPPAKEVDLELNNLYIVETFGAKVGKNEQVVKLNLKASSKGGTIGIIDGSSNAQNRPILVAGNGININGKLEDLVLDVNNFSIELIYDPKNTNYIVGGI